PGNDLRLQSTGQPSNTCQSHQTHPSGAATMKIVVTGANGKSGTEAVIQLKAAGHKVVSWDIVGPGVTVDCADFGQVFAALSGVDAVAGKPDAVLHLAGIPMPGRAPDHVIFENNTLSTYNVFSACQR